MSQLNVLDPPPQKPAVLSDSDSERRSLDQVAKLTEGRKTLDIAFDGIFNTFLQVLTLCMAIAAMISAGVTFAGTVSPSQIASFGASEFAIVKAVLVFYPLVYVPWLFLLFNNAASVGAYHEFIEEGVLIDFPATSSVGYVLHHNMSFAFLVSFIFYVTYAGVLFIRFSTPFNVIAIFFKQFFMEVILFYLSLLTVDSELMSLKEFIEKHDDRPEHKENPVIDRYSLQRAADNLRNYACVTADAAFTSYARLHRRPHPTSRMQLFMNGQYVFMVLGLVGVGYFQYQMDSRDEVRDKWSDIITPCVQVCVDRSCSANSSSSSSSLFGGAWTASVDVSACQDCLCACLSASKVSAVSSACLSYLNVARCTAVNPDAVCAPLGTSYCKN